MDQVHSELPKLLFLFRFSLKEEKLNSAFRCRTRYYILIMDMEVTFPNIRYVFGTHTCVIHIGQASDQA